MIDIRHRLGINAPQHQVHEALATTEGVASWWTRDAQGDATEGGKLELYFGRPEPKTRARGGRGHRRPGPVARAWKDPTSGSTPRSRSSWLTPTARPSLLFTHAGWREAGPVRGPLLDQVGVLPARPEVAARRRPGHAVPRRPPDQQLGLTTARDRRPWTRCSGRWPTRAAARCSTACRPATGRTCESCAPSSTWPASRSASTWRSSRRPAS